MIEPVRLWPERIVGRPATDEDMPGQPSLPLPDPLVDEKISLGPHTGSSVPHNEDPVTVKPDGRVKVVGSRFAAGAPPWTPRTSLVRMGTQSVDSGRSTYQKERSAAAPLDTAPLLQTRLV